MEEGPTFPLFIRDRPSSHPHFKEQVLTFESSYTHAHLLLCDSDIIALAPNTESALKVSTFHSFITCAPHAAALRLFFGFCVAVKVVVLLIWAVWSDGTAEVVNNLLRHTALRRVTNVRQRNGPREVRAWRLTSATPPPRSATAHRQRKLTRIQFDGGSLFLCLPTIIKTCTFLI